MANYWRLSLWLILSISIVLLCSDMGIFWDNVLFVSKMGNPLYMNGIFNWSSIPVSADPGHPPFIASLMAAGWKFFGKYLAVSHWIMLPFIFGFFWQLDKFVKYFSDDTVARIFAFILIIADPTLSSQLILVSPEIIQLFFFFIAINGILYNKILLKITGLLLLSIVSFRGMMLCAGIFLFEVISGIYVSQNRLKETFNRKMLISYLVSAIPSIGYISWRFINRGWIISNPLASWGNAFGFNSVTDFVSNIIWNSVVITHHILDFGRFVIFLVIITLGYKYRIFAVNKNKVLLLFIVLSASVIVVTSILIKNPMGHRYFIPIYIGVAMLAFQTICKSVRKKLLYIFTFTSLISGNLIVYPDTIAQGWDSSLAHVPYWELRKKAIRYMDDNKINIEETASFFPNRTAIDNVDLNNDYRSFSQFSGSEKFVLFSNVYNLTDKDFQLLHQHFIKIKSFEKRRVRVEIWKHK